MPAERKRSKTRRSTTMTLAPGLSTRPRSVYRDLRAQPYAPRHPSPSHGQARQPEKTERGDCRLGNDRIGYGVGVRRQLSYGKRVILGTRLLAEVPR